MSSWLNHKAGKEAKTQEPGSLHTTPRPSFSTQTDPSQAGRVSMERKLPATPLPATYTTPHDIVLSGLHGTFLKSDSHDTPSDPALDAASQVPAKESAQQSTSRLPSSEVLMDPFDGSVLGVLLPQGQGSDSQNPSQVNLSNTPLENVATGMNANPAGSEAVWSQLSRVLDIQGEISKMHLDMETIGLNRTRAGSENLKRKKSHSKRPHKATTENVGPLGHEDISGENWPRKRAISTVSTISSSGEPEGDETGNFQDDEGEKSRIRGEEFAKLSSQFEGRKEAIHDIMAKLDDLSQALGEFHELPIPNIEFPASRSASMGIASLPTEPELKLGGSSGRNSRLSGGSISRNIETTSPAVLSLAIPPLQRAKSETAAISSPSSTRRKFVPTLLVNSLELSKQPHISGSPVSAIGPKPAFDG